MLNRKHAARLAAFCAIVAFAIASFAATSYPSSETDIYGNTIYTNASGVVTYRFLKSGDTQDVLSVSNSTCLATVETSALDAVFKSVWASVGGWLYATPTGMMIIYR